MVWNSLWMFANWIGLLTAAGSDSVDAPDVPTRGDHRRRQNCLRVPGQQPTTAVYRYSPVDPAILLVPKAARLLSTKTDELDSREQHCRVRVENAWRDGQRRGRQPAWAAFEWPAGVDYSPSLQEWKWRRLRVHTQRPGVERAWEGWLVLTRTAE